MALPRCRTSMRRAMRPLVLPLSLMSLLSLVAALGGCEMPSPPPVPPRGEPRPNPDPDPDPDPSPEATLDRAPYLQMLGTSSVLIAFQTRTQTTVRVDYGPSLAYGVSVESPAAIRHVVRLTGLEPGRRYWYRLRAGTTVLAAGDDLAFETDGGRAAPEFSFFATGDIGEPGGRQAATAARVLAITPRASIGILCGDIIYPDGESAGYDPYLMRPWAELLGRIAVWPALGNHDWHVDPETNFRAEWYLPGNEHWFSFERGNAHFIALDSRDGDLYDAQAQVAWLRADLAAHRDAEWTFVYYHHPGYTCTYKGTNDVIVERLHPVFDEFRVDMVFTGHAHTYERLYPLRGAAVVNREQDPSYVDPQGTIYVTTGCGAKTENTTTRDCDMNAVAIDRTILVTHVTVRGRSLELRTIESANGVVRDRITITKSQ